MGFVRKAVRDWAAAEKNHWDSLGQQLVVAGKDFVHRGYSVVREQGSSVEQQFVAAVVVAVVKD